MGTWIAGAIVLAIAVLAVFKILKDSKNGKGVCCGGCSKELCKNKNTPSPVKRTPVKER